MRTPLSCRGGLFFGTPRCRALRDRDVRDGRLAPFRSDANFGIASGPVRSRKPRSSRACIPALVSKQSPASRRCEEFCRDSSTDRFPLPVTFTLARQTGGAAIMRKGPNLLKLARKEQCLALLNSMRAKNKINGCVYRVFPSGEVQYLHPKDGVYPRRSTRVASVPTTTCAASARTRTPRPSSSVARCTRMASPPTAPASPASLTSKRVSRRVGRVRLGYSC